jgi:hypothetical protein
MALRKIMTTKIHPSKLESVKRIVALTAHSSNYHGGAKTSATKTSRESSE